MLHLVWHTSWHRVLCNVNRMHSSKKPTWIGSACFTWLAAFISYVTKGSQNSTLIGLPCFAWAVRANDLIYMTKGRQSTEDPAPCFNLFENISHEIISVSNPGGRHFTKVIHMIMRTYLVFGVPPPGFRFWSPFASKATCSWKPACRQNYFSSS